MIKNEGYHIIGIDGGASNSRGILMNSKGKTLATAFEKGTNLAVYGETAAERIIHIISDLCQTSNISFHKVDAVGLGLAGGVVILLVDLVYGAGFFRLLLLIGVGYMVGGGVRGAAKGRYARGLQVIAAIGVIVSAVFEAVVLVGSFTLLGGVYGLLALLLGIWVAVSRVWAP